MRLPVPVMIAPVGVLSILHKDADLAVARAAPPRRADHPEHGGFEDDGRRRRRIRRFTALVPALLA